ncbi:sigma-54 dependent transcriptional regulator [uncultured Alistipes sp.]|uniref:sigma-54-dependent transcriptional regulator n=1 Tax=uncultured Alistipes sp. TaxID=538949 RepID=UPI0025F0C2AA|nr:sigma-54 dependent transcriptional regulator [uncultured Alistipes sp.]
MAKVLILDESKSMRNTLRERLEYEGFSTEAAENEAVAMSLCEKVAFDIILSDMGCKVPNTGVPFIILSSEASIDSAVEAVRNGAQDYLTKPINMNRLLQSMQRIIEQPTPINVPVPVTVPTRRSRRSSNGRAAEIIGTSAEVVYARRLIEKVAPYDVRVLITGENGTGKELAARQLHAQSSRANAPFIEVNCAAIPSELIESELFGHEKGAFTSAIKQSKGKFEQADGGTLFMDEIGDMSLAAQAKVLRALQENKITRVGSDKNIDVNVRVIAATNKNLREEIRKGNFREDLYHRIGVIVMRIPALREHAEDIPVLTDHFIRTICTEYDFPPKPIDKDAMDELQTRPWSGNIRELRNVVERLIILSEERITLEDVKKFY